MCLAARLAARSATVSSNRNSDEFSHYASSELGLAFNIQVFIDS